MKHMTAAELEVAQSELDTFKTLSAWIRDRQSKLDTDEFTAMKLEDQLAYMIVTKAGLQVLDQLVTDAAGRWGVDLTAPDGGEDGEGKLAQVIQLFDGNRRRVELN